MNRLVLIDGNAILHRAYHALPPLTAPDGKVVNAVYGFASMLMRLATDLVPSHLVVCFDRPAPTFRKTLYAGYQAKRPKMDDELVGQISIVHDVLKSFHVPVFEKDGFEADDLIGTIVKKSSVIRHQSSDNIDEIIIVTGDRDLLQLVNKNVFCYMPTKGLSEAKLYGENEAEERLGVKPTQIPDYKALAGDQSDNIPGVTGIGPKTAQELLRRFGSVEHVYEAIEKNITSDISEGVIEKLKKDKDMSLLSKTLATIKADVPIELSFPEFTKDQFMTEEALGALQELGFTSLVKRVTMKKEPSFAKATEGKGKKDNESEQLALV